MQPWAEIGERFQRDSFPMSFLKSGYHFDFWQAVDILQREALLVDHAKNFALVNASI